MCNMPLSDQCGTYFPLPVVIKGGQLKTAIGSAVEKSADNKEGIGVSYDAAVNAGTGWLKNLDNANNTSKQKIKKAQELLKKEGYYHGIADGIIGKNTTIAIKKYQKDHELPVTEYLDESTCTKMGI